MSFGDDTIIGSDRRNPQKAVQARAIGTARGQRRRAPSGPTLVAVFLPVIVLFSASFGRAQVIEPSFVGNIVDLDGNFTGDVFGTAPYAGAFFGVDGVNYTDDRRAVLEYDLSGVNLADVTSLRFAGSIFEHTPLDNGVRETAIDVYPGDGALTLSDFKQTPTGRLGSLFPVSYDPATEDRVDFDFDFTPVVPTLISQDIHSLMIQFRPMALGGDSDAASRLSADRPPALLVNGSTIPLADVPAPTGRPAEPGVPSDTSFTLVSLPGDYIGQGVTQVWDESNSTISATRNFDDGIRITVGSSGWTIEFAGPDGSGDLAVGVYEDARRFPFQDAHPGLDFSGNGRGSNVLSGRFVVYDVAYGPGGEVLRFAADFEQHGEGRTAASFGQVRFHSLVPEPSTYALAMMAAGSLFVLAWRGKRGSRVARRFAVTCR